MVAIQLDHIDIYGNRVLTYPECPYSNPTLCKSMPDCDHKKSRYKLCFTNHLKPVTCPFNIHEELGGI